MAVSNTLSAVIPTLYAKGLMALRSNLVMPNLVMNDFGTEVRQKGEVIQVPMPSLMTTTAVTPAAYAPDPQNIAPTTAPIALDNWYESAFTLTEKEVAQINAGVTPMQLSAAMQALAFQINSSIIANYKYVPNIVGTAGTTPFASSPAVATSAGAILTNQLAPMMDRRLVLNPTAYANAVVLPQFAYALYAGDTEANSQGIIRHKFGFDWAQDQQIATQTAGTLTGTVTASATVTSTTYGALTSEGTSSTAGMPVSTVTINTGTTSSFAPNVGDIITFSGDTQTYTVLSGSSLGASTSGSFTIFPQKVVTLAGGETVTLTASHVANLAFHKEAFAFASRPLTDNGLPGLGGRDPNLQYYVPDPVSGIHMRLIIREEYHRTRAAFDVLWGTAPIRPQLAVRVMG